MNAPSPDGPPSDSPLDIERVEWVPATPDTVLVLVVGRWRSAVPRGQPELVMGDARIEADEHETIEGTWRAAFTVPIELRSRLDQRFAMAIGSTEVSLPAASAGPEDEASAPPPATVVDVRELDERRARRVEGAEESLVRRAQAAEATAATLRTQLEHLEERLREAVAERDALTRDLRTAEQREEAERRVRLEALEERDAARADADKRVGGLRAKLRAAELHASELAREMDAVRREGAEAQQAAVAARHAAQRAEAAAAEREAELAERLKELGAEAGEVSGSLAAERHAREELEIALVAERERVATLEAEVERRSGLAASVRGDLEALRGDLARVRADAEAGGGEANELRAVAAGLRARVEELERGERAMREELERRAAELERARVALEGARAELASARDAEAARTSALREAEAAADDVRREAAELRRRVEDERRRRFEVEAELRAELEREREELGGRIATAEGTLRAQLAAERHAFQEQATAIERTAGELRERLAGAAAQLEARTTAEREAREAAEREVGRLRAEVEERAAREAEVGALVGDLLQTSTNLREGFERELRGLEEEVRARLAGEQDGLRAQLVELERHVAELQTELDRERAARADAERELAAARGPAAASTAGMADLEQAKSRLTDAEEQLERAREREDLHAQARAMIRNLEEAEARLRAERQAIAGEPAEEEDETAIESASGAVEPEAFEDLPEPPAAPPAQAAEATPPPVASEPEPEPVPEPPEPSPSDDPIQRAAAELAAAQRAAAERAAARRAARRAAAATTGAGEPIRPRVVPLDVRRPTPWLLQAMERLAVEEPPTAVRLLTALLPAQGAAVTRGLTYALEVDGDGMFRVELGGGIARVEPLPPATVPGPDVEVRVGGTARTLAPLVAGGAGRRLQGARIFGRKRRLKPLLKARRDPVTLADLAGAALSIDPGLVLRALAIAIDPSWTRSHSFSVVYEVTGASPGTHYVTVADGAPVVTGTGRPAEAPAATVTVGRLGFLSLLARVAPPPGERAIVAGDLATVQTLCRWADRVQGIPEGD